MCLYKKTRFPELTIFPKKVYKILELKETHSFPSEKTYLTPCRHTEAVFNTVLKAEKGIKSGISNSKIKGEGIHACKRKEEALRLAFLWNYCTSAKHEVFEAIIPPFTFYWKGYGYSIASRRLIITDKRIT